MSGKPLVWIQIGVRKISSLVCRFILWHRNVYLKNYPKTFGTFRGRMIYGKRQKLYEQPLIYFLSNFFPKSLSLSMTYICSSGLTVTFSNIEKALSWTPVNYFNGLNFQTQILTWVWKLENNETRPSRPFVDIFDECWQKKKNDAYHCRCMR